MDERGSDGAPHAPGGRPAPVVAALTSATIAGIAVASCSLVLDFDGSAETIDADLPPDAAPPSACDEFEDNDTLENAAPIAAGIYELGLCDGQEADYFAVELQADQRLRVAITYEPEEGRHALDLRLLDGDTGGEINSISSEDGEASIVRDPQAGTPLPEGTYAVEVSMGPTVTDPLPEALYVLTVQLGDDE